MQRDSCDQGFQQLADMTLFSTHIKQRRAEFFLREGQNPVPPPRWWGRIPKRKTLTKPCRTAMKGKFRSILFISKDFYRTSALNYYGYYAALICIIFYCESNINFY